MTSHGRVLFPQDSELSTSSSLSGGPLMSGDHDLGRIHALASSLRERNLHFDPKIDMLLEQQQRLEEARAITRGLTSTTRSGSHVRRGMAHHHVST